MNYRPNRTGTQHESEKINITTLFISVIATLWVSFFSFTVFSEYDNLNDQKKEIKKEISSLNKEIEWYSIYNRLFLYWEKVQDAEGLLHYKDRIPDWYSFLQDFRKNLPTNITIKKMSYSIDSWIVTIDLTSPTTFRLFEVFSQIEDYEGLQNTQFSSILAEEIGFWDNDDRKYIWYWSTVTANIDDDYLYEKYIKTRDLKSIRYKALSLEDNIENTFDNIDIIKNKDSWTWITTSTEYDLNNIEDSEIISNENIETEAINENIETEVSDVLTLKKRVIEEDNHSDWWEKDL